MSTRVVISDKALREMVREALDGQGWSGTDNADPVNVNAITDPSSAVVDPVNPNFTPQDKTEFGVAMQQLVKNLPDTDMPTVFNAVKTALDRRSEKDEIDAANQAAMVAGSQEAIDAAGKNGKDTKKQEGKQMPTENKVEEQLRARIRKAILEANGLTEADLPPVKKIPMGVHGGEFNRRHEKTKADLRKTLGPAVDRYENEPEAEPDLSDEEGEEAEHKAKHAHQEIGALGQVGNASFEDIAKETGMSVSGAKQAVDKSLLRFKFLYELPEDDRDIMVLQAMNDYIDTLNKTGELTAADVQLLKDHPDIVRELDGFRDYLHNTVRRAMKAKPEDLEDPLGEGDDALDEEDIEMKSVADKSKAQPPKAAPSSGGKDVKMASGKKASVDWGGFDEGKRMKSPLLAEAATIVMSDNKGPYVIADGVEARPSNPNHTQYRSGTKVNVHRRGKKGIFIVEMPNGERWTNEKLEETPRPKGRGVIAEANPAAMARKRKQARPDLYCPKCLWMTGGGPCERHGGPPWTEELQRAAIAKSRGEV